jgi:hypothetical protein
MTIDENHNNVTNVCFIDWPSIIMPGKLVRRIYHVPGTSHIKQAITNLNVPKLDLSKVKNRL